MMLKPRDIANVDFRQAWRGYNPDDVDQFVRKVVSAYEEAYQETLRLGELNEQLKQRITEYSQTEVQIDETLALARQSAADVKAAAEQRSASVIAEADQRSRRLLSEAEKRSSTVIAEAKAKAEEIIRDAKREVETLLSGVRQLTSQEQDFRKKFRDLLESYWALLEEERRDAEQLTHALRHVEEQVAASSDVGIGETAQDRSGWYMLDEEDEVDDIVDNYGTYDERPSVGSSDTFDDNAQDTQPTRRMDELRAELRGDGSV